MILIVFCLVALCSSASLPGNLGADHVGFVVRNASEASHFFMDVLGCRFDWRVEREKTPDARERGWDTIFGVPGDAALVDVWMLQCGRYHLAQYVEFFEWHLPSHPQREQWPSFEELANSYFAITVESVDRVVEALKRDVFPKYPGTRMIQDPPMQFPLRGELCTSFFFTTPWGMWIEVSEWSDSTPRHPHLNEQDEVRDVDDAGETVVAAESKGAGQQDVSLLPTPAVLVDLDAVDENVRLLHTRLEGVKWMAVAKAHRSPAFVEYLVRKGAAGVIVLTVDEAALMAEHVTSPILIHLHNEVVAPANILRFVTLQRKYPHHTFRINVDSEVNVADLSNAAAGANVKLHVAVEVNIGHNRSGVDTFEQLLRVAQLAVERESLILDGITGYEGHTPVLKPEAKQVATHKAHEVLKEAKAKLESHGIAVAMVSGGGSSNYVYALQEGVVSELQAGGVALADKLYLHLANLEDFDHIPALFVDTTVISTGEKPLRATADAGFKSVGLHPFAGLPLLVNVSGWAASGLSAEHLRMKPSADTAAPPLGIGQRLRVIPGYGDSFLSSQKQIYGIRRSKVELLFR